MAVEPTNGEQHVSRARLSMIWERCSVLIVFILFVVLRAADRVLLKRVNNLLKDPTYNLVLMNVFWPPAIALLTAVMLMGYVAIMRQQGNTQYSWRFFLPGNAAASRMGPVPLYQFALLQLGDQLNAALAAPSTPFISQTMQSVMTNTTIIWTAVLAFIFLQTRFRQVHAIGCIVIVLSVIVGLSNKLVENDCSPEGVENNLCFAEYKGVDKRMHLLSTGTMVLWYGLFLLSILPSAASQVYKQHVLQGNDVDVVYATWWSGNFQVIWGWLCAMLIWVPLPESHPVQLEDTGMALRNTFSCMLGNTPRGHLDASCAESSLPPIAWFGLYLCFNLSFNILLLWLTKRMSATWAQIATVLCLDLTNIFGQWSVLAGAGAQSLSLYDVLATALASVALWIYSLEPETSKAQEMLKKAQVSPLTVATATPSGSFSEESIKSIGHSPLLTSVV